MTVDPAAAAPPPVAPRSAIPSVALLVTLGVLAVTAIRPFDGPTWWLEVAPILIATPILVATKRRWPWTGLLYGLLAVHAVILAVGGHYTYAHVPFGEWMRDVLHTERNPYDRLGHLAQGFIPAIAFREMLLRATPLQKGKAVFFLVLACCLAVSALYELVEWLTSVTAGDASLEFLGVQGDVWDAQWDMLFALIGAILGQLLLGRLHDRAIFRLTGKLPD